MDTRTLDHTKSNLPVATEKEMTLEEVTAAAQTGELGSTEVPPNQVW